jgi:hypothetical protein
VGCHAPKGELTAAGHHFNKDNEVTLKPNDDKQIRLKSCLTFWIKKDVSFSSSKVHVSIHTEI